MAFLPTKNKSSSVITASGILGYFCRKGNKEGVEKRMYNLFFNRVKNQIKGKDRIK